jgi:hypothetical protein
MAYNNVVDTLTLEDIVPQVVDTVLRTNTFATKMLTKPKKFRAATQDFPIKYQTGTAVQSFQGFDTLPTSFTDTRVLMKYNPKFIEANVALAATDIAANNTYRQILSLVQVEMMSRAQDLADAVGTMFYADGTGNSSKDMLGLGAIVDNGNSVATIGGLSRSTYTTLQSTVTASGGVLTLYKMRTLYNAIGDAGAWPTMGLTDFTTWALYEQLLQPQERIYKDITIAKNFKGYTGFDIMANGLAFGNLTIIPDRKCTAGVLFELNEDFIHFWALPVLEGAGEGSMVGKPVKVGGKLFQGNQYDAAENLGFFWTGWIKATSQLAYNSFVVLGGNLLTDNPRRQGKLTGITSI